jgi:hypothetical protein
MKKAQIIIALMMFSSQIFAQKGTYDSGSKGRPDIAKPNCPDYLDCNTGEIQYFEYKKDFTIDAPEVCGPWGVKAIIIQKGKYIVDRSSGNRTSMNVTVGKIVFPPNAKAITVESTNPKGPDCKSYGNACFFSTNLFDDNDNTLKLIITPIMENDACVALKIEWPQNGKAEKGISEKGLKSEIKEPGNEKGKSEKGLEKGIKENGLKKGNDPRNPGF